MTIEQHKRMLRGELLTVLKDGMRNAKNLSVTNPLIKESALEAHEAARQLCIELETLWGRKLIPDDGKARKVFGGEK